MLLTGIFLLCIEAAITFHLMKTVVLLLAGMPDRWYRKITIAFFLHPFIAFILNLLVSTLLSSFTGAGLISGIANLGSSVLVALLSPPILRKYIPMSTTRAVREVHNERRY